MILNKPTAVHFRRLTEDIYPVYKAGDSCLNFYEIIHTTGCDGCE